MVFSYVEWEFTSQRPMGIKETNSQKEPETWLSTQHVIDFEINIITKMLSKSSK